MAVTDKPQSVLDNDQETDTANIRVGNVIEGSDNPTPKRTSQPIKPAMLQPPVSGSPVIMKDLAALLAKAKSSQQRDVTTAAQVLLSTLRKGTTLDWTNQGWALGDLPLPRFLAELRRSLQTESVALANSAGMLRTRLRRALPLDGAGADLVYQTLLVKAAGVYPAVVREATAYETNTPHERISALHNALGEMIIQPQVRRKLNERTLAALDTLYEDAGYALDGLQLGLTIGLADGSDGGPSSGDPSPSAPQDPIEQGAETNIIRESGSHNTLRDVAKADMLLARVNGGLRKATNPADNDRDDTAILVVEQDTAPTADVRTAVADPQADVPQTAVREQPIPQRYAEIPGSPTEDPTGLAKANLSAEPPHPDTAPADHKGVMLAWLPTSGLTSQLGKLTEGGESPEDLHMTLIYIASDYAAIPEEKRQQLRSIVAEHALTQRPLEGSINGITSFNPSASSDHKRPLVALADVPGLSEWRAELVKALRTAGFDPPMTHGFIPHITLKYKPPGMDDMEERGIPRVEDTPIVVDKVHLVWGNDDRDEFSLDAGVGQVSGQAPLTYREKLPTGDQAARSPKTDKTFAEIFDQFYQKSAPDPRYRLAMVEKTDTGEQIVSLDDDPDLRLDLE